MNSSRIHYQGYWRRMETEISEQFGKTFNQLYEAVGRLVDWQGECRQQMSELKKIVIDIRDQPKEDYTTKYYTRKEAAKICRRSVQTIDKCNAK